MPKLQSPLTQQDINNPGGPWEGGSARRTAGLSASAPCCPWQRAHHLYSPPVLALPVSAHRAGSFLEQMLLCLPRPQHRAWHTVGTR